MVNFERAGDMDAGDIKIMIFGDSGAGKTWAMSTAGSDLAVLVLERNAIATIKAANPDAQIFYTNNIDGVREFMGAAAKGDLAKQGIKRIGIDGLTEIQQLFKDEILAGKGDEDGRNKSDESDKSMTMKDWGTLTDKMRRFLRMMRDVRLPIVATALAEHVSDDKGVVYAVQPAVQGRKLANEMAQYFNVVGYCFKRKKTNEAGEEVVYHRTMVNGPSMYTVKPCPGLTNILEPNIAAWYDAIAAHTSTNNGTASTAVDANATA